MSPAARIVSPSVSRKFAMIASPAADECKPLQLRTFGERGDDDALRRAVAAFEAALEVFVAARADYYIEVCRNNRDGAQALLAKRKS